MANIKKKYYLFKLKYLFVILFIITTSCFSSRQTEFRSIDNERYMKSQRRSIPKPSREERRMMKIERKTIKKQQKAKKEREKQQKKAAKKYRKKVSGSGRELVDGKKVHRRMKRSEREARKFNRRSNPNHWTNRLKEMLK